MGRMTTLREELEKLADATWPHGGPRYGRTELAVAVANLALEAAARECEQYAGEQTLDYDSQQQAVGADDCAAAIRAMRVE